MHAKATDATSLTTIKPKPPSPSLSPTLGGVIRHESTTLRCGPAVRSEFRSRPGRAPLPLGPLEQKLGCVQPEEFNRT